MRLRCVVHFDFRAEDIRTVSAETFDVDELVVQNLGAGKMGIEVLLVQNEVNLVF